MLRINIGTSYDTEEKIINENTTIRQAFKDAGVSLTSGTIVTNNGSRLGDRDLDKTFAELGVEEDALITANEKTIGA